MAYDPTIPALNNYIGDDIPAIAANFVELADSRIVEMGSNSNGEYVRWENGLQVCFRSVVLNVVTGEFLSSGTQQWPAEFSARPFVTAPTYQTLQEFPFENVRRTDIKNIYYHNLTSANFSLRMYQDGSGSFQDGDSIEVFVIAVGRWK